MVSFAALSAPSSLSGRTLELSAIRKMNDKSWPSQRMCFRETAAGLSYPFLLPVCLKQNKAFV